jgi:hypothetical protein
MLESAWPSVYVYSSVCGQTNTDFGAPLVFGFEIKAKIFSLVGNKRGEKFG